MIGSNSILHRLPADLDNEQTLFLDGIRHAAEIADFAYNRLLTTLTKISVSEESNSESITLAYLDAWAIVDSIDRYRTLWNLFPNSVLEDEVTGLETDVEVFRNIRNVRNVSDHLSQRVKYILSNRGTALGGLSWCTILDIEKSEGVICTIIPGTVGKQSGPIVNPSGKEMEIPTGLISLTAGEHSAQLSEAVKRLRVRILDIETQLEENISNLGLTGKQAGADVVLRMRVSFKDKNSE